MVSRGSVIYLEFYQGQCTHPDFSRFRMNSNLLGSGWLLGTVSSQALGSTPVATVLGLTPPREVGTFVLFLDVRQNP